MIPQAIKHKTGISWTHAPGFVGATWNPSTGCTRVSPGCDHCYAFALHDHHYAANLAAAKAMQFRQFDLFGWTGTLPEFARSVGRGAELTWPAQYDAPFSQVQILGDKRMRQPLGWKPPHFIFVDSMADLFHDAVPDGVLDVAFAVMAMTQRHRYVILTKRPERMRRYMNDPETPIRVYAQFQLLPGYDREVWPFWPTPNVCLGVSAEDQQRADERVPVLLETMAASRLVSAEPLLGPLDLSTHLGIAARHEDLAGRLSWVIAGGESGQHWRPMEHDWIASIHAQCAAAGVAYYGKQDATFRSEVPLPGPLGDRAWPERLLHPEPASAAG